MVIFYLFIVIYKYINLEVNMSVICKYLAEEIHFAPTRIVPCGASVWDSEKDIVEKYFVKPNVQESNTDFTQYFNKRAEYIEMYKNGNKPTFCQDCERYAPIECDTSNLYKHKFSKVNIYNRTLCNCRCIYCCLAAFGKDEAFIKMNSEQNYDIKPILAKIDELDLVDDGVEIAIFGGECTTYPDELEYIVKWGEKYKAKFIILSNGIIYNKTFERLVTSGNVELRFSIDCGSKEKFEKIKKVKTYDKVINNIDKYCKLAKNNPNACIQLRYLLCPNLNDDLKDLKEFFELALNLQVNNVVLGFERDWLQHNIKYPIPKKMKKFIKYYMNRNNFTGLNRGIDRSEVFDWWFEKLISDENSDNLINRLFSFFKK